MQLYARAIEQQLAIQQIHATVVVRLPLEKMREAVAGQLLRTETLTCCCCPGKSMPADGENDAWGKPLLEADHDAPPPASGGRANETIQVYQCPRTRQSVGALIWLGVAVSPTVGVGDGVGEGDGEGLGWLVGIAEGNGVADGIGEGAAAGPAAGSAGDVCTGAVGEICTAACGEKSEKVAKREKLLIPATTRIKRMSAASQSTPQFLLPWRAPALLLPETGRLVSRPAAWGRALAPNGSVGRASARGETRSGVLS